MLQYVAKIKNCEFYILWNCQFIILEIEKKKEENVGARIMAYTLIQFKKT